MKRYRFELQETTIPAFVEKDHIILANSLADAIHKFRRKHDLVEPAYWDEPSFDTHMEIIFKDEHKNSVTYQISW